MLVKDYLIQLGVNDNIDELRTAYHKNCYKLAKGITDHFDTSIEYVTFARTCPFLNDMIVFSEIKDTPIHYSSHTIMICNVLGYKYAVDILHNNKFVDLNTYLNMLKQYNNDNVTWNADMSSISMDTLDFLEGHGITRLHI